ncbi:MAG: hypothetical protein GEEBNDBF_02528 [bacterium]|nr:hypothetical protein [bacterium]
MPRPEITQHVLIAQTPEGYLIDTQLLANRDGKVTEESVAEKVAGIDFETLRGATVLLKGCAPTWVFMLLTHRLHGVAAHIGFRGFDGRAQMIS